MGVRLKPTNRQRKLAQVIAENAVAEKPLNKTEMLVKVGYSTNTAQVKQKNIMEAKGVKQALDDLGFTEEAAFKVVEEIMNNKNVDPAARLKATDQVFKIKGTYAPEKSIIANISVDESKREKTNELIRNFLTNKKDS